MDWGFLPKKKNRGVRLELAPLIDIFVMIIIFLIKGTYMGQATLALPDHLDPAMSKSIEGMEVAQEVYLFKDAVFFKMLGKKIPLEQIFGADQNQRTLLLNEVSQFQKNLPEKDSKSNNLVNFVADAGVQYKAIFELTKFLREAGFQNVLFVAMGEK